MSKQKTQTKQLPRLTFLCFASFRASCPAKSSLLCLLKVPGESSHSEAFTNHTGLLAEVDLPISSSSSFVSLNPCSISVTALAATGYNKIAALATSLQRLDGWSYAGRCWDGLAVFQPPCLISDLLCGRTDFRHPPLSWCIEISAGLRALRLGLSSGWYAIGMGSNNVISEITWGAF